jgi:uncharacterized membrane protein
MKIDKRLPKILWVLLIMPLASSIILYTRLPESMPIHWNINGEINQYVDKIIGAFFIPALCIIFLLTYIRFIPKASFNKSPKIYYSIASVISVLFLGMQIAIISISLGADFLRMDFVAKFIIGLTIMIFGNLMPKLKPDEINLSRNSWMLKAQRHGGYVWFVSGIAFMILSFIPGIASAIIYFCIIAVISVEPMLYAYLRYGKNNSNM